MADEAQQVNRKARIGTVVSDRNQQTVVVAVERKSPHRLYRKVVTRTKRYAVHDPDGQATLGDLVRIEECRPISKTKRWRLAAVLTERDVAEVAPESIDRALVDEMQRSAARAAAETEEEQGPATELPSAAEAEADAPDEPPASEERSEA